MPGTLAQVMEALTTVHFGFNALDLFIVGVILFYAYEGYSLGFVASMLDLASFVLSFILALKFYGVLAHILQTVFTIPIGFANALGFFIIALVSEIILNITFRKLVRFVPSLPEERQFTSFFRGTDKFFGLLPGIASACIILSFLLSIIVSLPSSPFLKELVTTSRFGKVLVANTATFEKGLNTIFGGALNETLTFLTVKPESNESVDLKFSVPNGTVDAQAEQEMFRMVNEERVKAGLAQLVFDTKLRDLARYYSDDMFRRGYFSHYNPEGESPFDRMDKVGIEYLSAGENLALAPSTELAMQGLMNSPGHRANILSPNFGKIGIGAIDGGIYGKMYTQEFTN